jgi:hypothetical protein
MEDVNKNTELNNTDKKLHISDVSCRFCGSSNFESYHMDIFKIQSPRWEYDIEHRITESIKIRICECGIIVKNDN